MAKKIILLLAGDGIGPEIMVEAKKIILDVDLQESMLRGLY